MSHAVSIPVDPKSAAPQKVLPLEDVLSNLDHYRARPALGFEALRDNTDHCADPRVAAVFVECALAVGRVDLAEIALPMVRDETGIFAAMVYMTKEQPKRALEALVAMPTDVRHQTYAFGLRIKANIMTRQYDAACKAVHDWATATPSSPQPYRVMGNALSAKGDERATRWFERAINVSGGGSGAVLDMAAFLAKQGRVDDARAHLKSLKYVSGRTKRRKQRLLNAL